MGSIVAAIAAVANYVVIANNIINAVVNIGEDVAPVAEMLWARIKSMTAENRGPTEQETADLNAMMTDYQAKLDARAAEAEAKIAAEGEQ